MSVETGSADVWYTLAIAITSVTAIVVENIRTRRKVEVVNEAAKEAARLALPIGNGFAPDVISSLRRIEKRQDSLSTRIDSQGDRLDTLSDRLSSYIDGQSRP